METNTRKIKHTSCIKKILKRNKKVEVWLMSAHVEYVKRKFRMIHLWTKNSNAFFSETLTLKLVFLFINRNFWLRSSYFIDLKQCQWKNKIIVIKVVLPLSASLLVLRKKLKQVFEAAWKRFESFHRGWKSTLWNWWNYHKSVRQNLDSWRWKKRFRVVITYMVQKYDKQRKRWQLNVAKLWWICELLHQNCICLLNLLVWAGYCMIPGWAFNRQLASN